MFSSILASIGELFSKSATSFSWFWYHDETKCPKSLIK